ncbi:MAG: division/cell wall cluster transcriptional repressor MraZ [Candidatus Paceibacterota bacterium]
MLFLGEFHVSFSGKGRLVVPKKIRQALGKETTFTLTKGYDASLAGYRRDDWRRGTSELTSGAVMGRSRMDFRRQLFSSAVKLEIDDQGRVVIPQSLLEYARLANKKKAVIIGVGTHFEIWDLSRWESYSMIIKKKLEEEES